MAEPMYVYNDREDDREDFEVLVKGLVERGDITRETLDEVRNDLRFLAEEELDKQGK